MLTGLFFLSLSLANFISPIIPQSGVLFPGRRSLAQTMAINGFTKNAVNLLLDRHVAGKAGIFRVERHFARANRFERKGAESGGLDAAPVNSLSKSRIIIRSGGR